MAIKSWLSNKWLWVGMVLIGILALGKVQIVPAQSPEQVWSPPINISLSGSAVSPVMVVVPDGPTFVVWQDEFDGIVFASRTEGAWSSPKAIDFPFEDTLPTLVADGLGNIHAFWLGDESALNYSSVSVENFGTANWTFATVIDDSVTAFNVVVSAKNDLHVTYVQTLNTEETPAGIYYQKRANGSEGWTTPVLLYPSAYLRLLPAENIKLELVTVEQGETEETLYLMWDNRPLGQLFLLVSEDAGATWGEPIELRGPANTSASPAAIGMAQTEDGVLVLWQEGISETNCRQFYQVFSFEGEATTTPQTMLSEYPVCADENQLISDAGENIILHTTLFNLNYLLAWDGSVWSEPQLQQELSNFINPDTLQPINLQCMQTVAGGADELFTVGCDNDLGGDIWFTYRALASTSEWFSSPSTWKPPVSFFSTESEISAMSLQPDAEGQLHAVWAQFIAETEGQMEIYYARWDGTSWSYIVPILQPPFARVNELKTAMDQAGRLFVVWSGGQSGEIYFSWANANLAGTPSEWQKPILLPMARTVGASPDIVVGENGTIYVTYAIPLNENRGIYLTTSEDGGASWSDPVQIVDGVPAGWEIVGNPTLSVAPSGLVQILFWRFPPPDGLDLMGLYYARSEDNGATWNEPVEVIRAELEAGWVKSFGQDVTYRIWQENRNGVLVTYLEASPDLGVSWTEPINFTGFDASVKISDVVLDNSGQLHLVQLVNDANLGLILLESVWNGTKWSNEERILIDADGIQAGQVHLQANITSDGVLGVLITRPINDSVVPGSDMIFTSRQIETNGVTLPPTPQIDPVPESTQTSLSEATLTPEATPAITPTASTERPTTPTQPAVDNTLLGPIVGLVASGVLVVLVFIVITRLSNRNN
ncbi:MAG: hypothetical protein HUU38_08715 [Anaerolineales bacterium]|nr:hypothetical protein [Anaerolineales bacterium]